MFFRNYLKKRPKLIRQENKFVAQLFHFLAPFVDPEKDLFICVDGAKALQNCEKKGSKLLDAALPDLWFTAHGRSIPIGIEAKIFGNRGISFRRSQIPAWQPMDLEPTSRLFGLRQTWNIPSFYVGIMTSLRSAWTLPKANKTTSSYPYQNFLQYIHLRILPSLPFIY